MLRIKLHLGNLCFVAFHLLLFSGPLYASEIGPRQDVPEAQKPVSKAGLAWPNGSKLSLKQFEGTGRVSWYYTWSAYPIDNNIEFVPMFWGKPSIEVWTKTVKEVLAKMTPKVTTVLGMNEPELASQANLTVQEGVELWKTYMEPLHDAGYRLGSPGPSSSPAGKQWLVDFIAACNGECHFDFISTHWYGTNATIFRQHIEDYRRTFQKPLWITEWACHDYVNIGNICTLDDVVEFMKVTQAMLDEVDYVERYAWFGAQKELSMVDINNALMDQNGIINDLGKQYINYTEADGPIDTSLPTFTSAASPAATGIITTTGGSTRFTHSAILGLTMLMAAQLTVYIL